MAVEPSIRRTARNADRQITVNTQSHTCINCRLIDRFQLLGAQPLQPHIKAYFIGVFVGKLLHRAIFGMLVILRPADPAELVGNGKILI